MKIQWSPIEEFDDAGVAKAVHIMPVTLNEGFDTREECEAFMRAVEDAGSPCIIDEDGMIVATFFGHEVKIDCSCGPEFKPDAITPTYFHRMTQ